MTWRSCFSCGARSNKDETSTRAYHRFPKDAGVRSRWLKFCNLNETDKVDTLFICSAHFTPNSYTPRPLRQGNDTGLQRLRRRAVPSVKIKRPKKTKDCTVQELKIEETFVAPFVFEEIDEEDSKAFQVDLLQEPACLDESSVRVEDPLAPTSRGNSFIERLTADLAGDDFSTREGIRRNFQILIDNINRKDEVIVNYRRKNKKLQTELDALYTLLSQLQKNKSITEEGERLLSEHFTSKIKDEN